LNTHEEKETRDKESFDPIPKTPENTDDEGNGEENLRTNVGREEGHDEEDEEDKLYIDLLELIMSKRSKKNTKYVNAADEELTAAKHKLMWLVYCC
nr:hypothetical protein [Tanacetum cinerariifolium]